MAKAELKLWTKYKCGIEERNRKGAEETLRKNDVWAEEHRRSQEEFYRNSVERTKRFEQMFGHSLPTPMRSFCMPPYSIFIGEHATYEGFLDYQSGLIKKAQDK